MALPKRSMTERSKRESSRMTVLRSPLSDELRSSGACPIGDLRPRDHPSDLFDASSFVEEDDASHRPAFLLILTYLEMNIGEGRDLREMGDAEHLVVF